MPRATFRRFFSVTAALFLAALVVGSPGTAHAEDGYRYWNYFHEKNGSWEFAQTAAAEHTPSDGAIEAYRFGTSTVSQGVEPRVDLEDTTFAAICAEEEAAEEEKRVGVLLDFGTGADADGETPPDARGECAVVAQDANGQQVLEAVADVRVEKGLTCAIDGYPVKDCGTPVPDAKVATDQAPVAVDLPSSDEPGDASPTAGEDTGDSDLVWPLVGVALLVAVIGAAALVLSRRNRSA